MSTRWNSGEEALLKTRLLCCAICHKRHPQEGNLDDLSNWSSEVMREGHNSVSTKLHTSRGKGRTTNLVSWSLSKIFSHPRRVERRMGRLHRGLLHRCTRRCRRRRRAVMRRLHWCFSPIVCYHAGGPGLGSRQLSPYPTRSCDVATSETGSTFWASCLPPYGMLTATW